MNNNETRLGRILKRVHYTTPKRDMLVIESSNDQNLTYLKGTISSNRFIGTMKGLDYTTDKVVFFFLHRDGYYNCYISYFDISNQHYRDKFEQLLLESNEDAKETMDRYRTISNDLYAEHGSIFLDIASTFISRLEEIFSGTKIPIEGILHCDKRVFPEIKKVQLNPLYKNNFKIISTSAHIMEFQYDDQK